MRAISTQGTVDYWHRRTKQVGDCWIWTGAIHASGYGVCTMADKTQKRAHVAAYIKLVGPVPAGLFVLHRCNVKACVNPEHLYVGTLVQNSADARAAGVGPYRLAPIVEAIKKSKGSYASLGRLYGVSSTTVSKIKKGLRWQT